MKKSRAIGSDAGAPLTLRYASRLWAPSGAARLEALQTDFRNMRAGILRQESIGSPKTCTGTPCPRRGAAIDRPEGPAPMTAVVVEGFRPGVIDAQPPRQAANG